MGTYIPSFSTLKKNNHKFSCIVNFRLFHMHCIKTAISILMYRFCKYYTMYVRLNCICSVYVIYLCPINVLILSDITRSFLNWKIPSLRGPFLAGQWCCRSLKQEWKPWLSWGRFWFVIGIILGYSWSVCWCRSAVHGMPFSQTERSTPQAARPPREAAVQPGWSLNRPSEGCCCSDQSFFQVDAKFHLRWAGSCTPTPPKPPISSSAGNQSPCARAALASGQRALTAAPQFAPLGTAGVQQTKLRGSKPEVRIWWWFHHVL